MSHNPEEKEPAFKVVDKRRFTEEGAERSVEQQEQVAEPRAQVAESSLNDAPKHKPVMSFTLFVQSLVHQTMMGLGLVPWPDSGLVKQELELAQQTIDILLILKEKTAGNLSKEEQGLLDGILYQLQVAFVEIAKTPPVNPGSVIK